MLGLVLRAGVAAIFAASALLKLARPRRSAALLEPFGFASPRVQTTVLGVTALVELGLAAGIAAGSATAAYTAAGLMLVFAGALAGALRMGSRGLPCPCFGAHGRVGPAAIVRNLLLAATCAALPFVETVELSTQAWLAIGLAIALVGVAVLTVAVLALMREIGLLRLRLPPEAALEVLSEGPELGRFAPIVDRFVISEGTRVALAVFSSPGCRLCQALEPGLASFAKTPGLAVRVFDEERDRDAWEELAVPGSPYAVAMDLDGTVRAKGTFNSLAQLASVVAAAERRAEASAHA